MIKPLVVGHVRIVLVALGVLGACREPPLAQGVSDSAFVATLAALKRVQDAVGIDSAQRAALRDSVLQGRGLTPAQLEAAARTLARNPARAQAVWQAIERRARDTTAVRK